MNLVVIFLSGLRLIAKIKNKEGSDFGEPDIILEDPYLIKESSVGGMGPTIEPWLSSVTKQKEFEVHSDKILTLAEPSARLSELYDEMTK